MPVAGLKAKGGGKCYSLFPLARSIQTKTAPMTSVSVPTNANSRSLEGIACVVIGMLLFVGQDGMMKFMLEIFPIWTLMAVRGLIALVVLLSGILYLNQFREGLIDARVESLMIQGRIIASAIAASMLSRAVPT